MKSIRFAFLLAPVALSGCMATNPPRPVLTCTNCGDLTYYGPQAPDPRVEMARALTGGLSSVVGIAVGGDVLKSLGSASGATSTIERTTSTIERTTNNTDRAAVTDRDHSSVTSASVSDTSVSNTSVSNTSVSNTSVSGTSVTNGP